MTGGFLSSLYASTRSPVLASDEDPLPFPTISQGIPAHDSAARQATASNSDDEIIYLDANGYLRVWDPVFVANESDVQWVSPVGGWRDFTVADVNLDGDMELIAVGGEADSGRLAIYDPVILDRSLVDPDRITNEIPWTVLYETPLLGRPIVVEADDLNPAIPGDEIAFVFALNDEDKIDPDDKSRISFLQAVLAEGAETPTGMAWESAAADIDFGNTWERLALGDLDADGQAEVVLVDDGVGLLRIYQLAADGPVKIYENESGARPWLDATVARFIPSTLEQVALARSSNVGGSTLWVLYYNPGDENGFSDSYAEFLLPPPRVVFHGDINNNGDDELFLLRRVPSGLPNVRLAMRNGGDDTLPIFEHVLDSDNGYQAGATGDTDGDGRAEVVIMRNNRIRIYTAPESAPTAVEEFVPPAVTNQLTIHTGNLDRNGYLQLPTLVATPVEFTKGIAAGALSDSSTMRITNSNSQAPDAISVEVTVAGEPDWLIVEPRSGSTPLLVDVRYDARFLAPGTYATQIIVTTAERAVLDAPQVVDVDLQVNPGLAPAGYAVAAPYNCADRTDTRTIALPLNGPTNLTFSASIIAAAAADSSQPTAAHASTSAAQSVAPAAPRIIWPSDVAWVTASSPNVLPATIQLTFDPAQLAPGVDTAEALLRLIYFDTDGRQVRDIDLSLYCTDTRLFLPLVNR
ncbi:MAG: VCBS repeat-containing protein [Caldilineaceae bacterium]|nr:VCBS repeat-containing protein [Caldilineaceae bacterium]